MVTSQTRAGGVGRVGVPIPVRPSLPESTRGASLLAMLELCGLTLVLPLVVPFIGPPVDIGPWPVV